MPKMFEWPTQAMIISGYLSSNTSFSVYVERIEVITKYP